MAWNITKYCIFFILYLFVIKWYLTTISTIDKCKMTFGFVSKRSELWHPKNCMQLDMENNRIVFILHHPFHGFYEFMQSFWNFSGTQRGSAEIWTSNQTRPVPNQTWLTEGKPVFMVSYINIYKAIDLLQ